MTSAKALQNTENKKKVLLIWETEPKPGNPLTSYLRLDHLPEPKLRNFEAWLSNGKNLPYLYSIEFSDHPEVQKLKEDIREIQWRIDDNLGTYDDAWLGVKNTFINKELILCKGDISRAKNTFKSAVLIAAGPSMNDCWDKISNECLIVTCDAMYQKCLEKGITPHIVATAERIGMCDAFFKDTIQDETVLVSTFMADPKGLAAWHGALNFVSRNDYPGRWYPLKKRRFMNHHASVIPTMLEICGMIGIKNVLLLGQDLSFQDDYSHADLGKNLKDQKDEIEFHEGNEPKVLVECHDGEMRKSTPVWITIRDAIYQAGKEWNLSISSASPTGAKIHDIPLVDPIVWYQQNQVGGSFSPELINKFEDEDREAWKLKAIKTKNFYTRTLTSLNRFDPYDLLHDPNMMLINNMMIRDYVSYLHHTFQSTSQEEHNEAKAHYFKVLEMALRQTMEVL